MNHTNSQGRNQRILQHDTEVIIKQGRIAAIEQEAESLKIIKANTRIPVPVVIELRKDEERNLIK